jgi:hypothetical protein
MYSEIKTPKTERISDTLDSYNNEKFRNFAARTIFLAKKCSKTKTKITL